MIEPAVRRMERWSGDIEVHWDNNRHRPGTARRIMSTTASPVTGADEDDIYYGIIMRDVTADRTHAHTLAEQARRLVEHLVDVTRHRGRAA